MRKRLFSLILTLLFIFPATITSFAEILTSLEAPQKVTVRNDDGTIRLRWTVPQNVLSQIDNNDGAVIYYIDWKKNDGQWHYSGPVNDSTLEQTPDEFQGDIGNLVTDEQNAQEVFFVYFHLGEADEFDFTNNTYTFRMRFAFINYDNESESYLTSPFSNEVSVGKNAGAEAPTSLAAPTNLKVETRKNTDGSPYFYLNWSNPASVDTVNKNIPIAYKVDFKVGNEPWYSEKNGHDWWGGELYASHIDFDPVKRELADKIIIDESTYYFRILYSYEPTVGNPVYSPFSNTVSIGIKKYESASPWAVPELDQAAELGLITEGIKDKMNAPITREEFAEVAVNFYELVTGKKAVPDPVKTFTDTTNPQILKAFNLKITAGVGDGTKFDPNGYLLRQQMAAMITRTLTACYPNLVFDVAGVPDFKDQKAILVYADIPTKFMAKYKITVGDGNGSFNPNDNCSREQAIAFLLRAYLYKDQYLAQ